VRPRRLAVLILALAAPEVRAQGPVAAKLVLDPLDARGVQRSIAAVVEQRVCQALQERSPGVDLVCPEDVAAAASIARQDVIMGRCSTEECMKHVEELKASPRRVNGRIERDAKGLVLSLVLSEGAGEPRTVSERLPEDLDALLARIPPLVRKLLP